MRQVFVIDYNHPHPKFNISVWEIQAILHNMCKSVHFEIHEITEHLSKGVLENCLSKTILTTLNKEEQRLRINIRKGILAYITNNQSKVNISELLYFVRGYCRREFGDISLKMVKVEIDDYISKGVIAFDGDRGLYII